MDKEELEKDYKDLEDEYFLIFTLGLAGWIIIFILIILNFWG